MFDRKYAYCILVFAFFLIGCNDEDNPNSAFPDSKPPEIEWISPEGNSELSGSVQLSFKVIDEECAIDRIAIYRNGYSPDEWLITGHRETQYTVDWNTTEVADGTYILEARAWDDAGNVGISPLLVISVANLTRQDPIVVWVPDDYDAIQDAVNASTNGDTVRVRPGIYHGMVYFWDKNIWLESEKGPEVTFIDATNDSYGIRCDQGQDTTNTIRGFTIQGGIRSIDFRNGSSSRIVNNIITTPEGRNVYADINRSIFVNNIFTHCNCPGSAGFGILACFS